MRGRDRSGPAAPTHRRRGVLEKAIQQQLHAEVVERAAEIDGGGLAGEHRCRLELGPGALEHFHLFAGGAPRGLVQAFADERVGEAGGGNRHPVGAAGRTLVEMGHPRAAVPHALEGDAGAERPVHRVGRDAEDAFQFVQQRQRLHRRPVKLVHEGEDRHAPVPADLEELAGLALDALAGVDDHNDRVDRRQHAVGVLGKVLVAGGVEQVDAETAVVELEDGRTDGDAAFLLQLHPVGGRGALVLARRHGAGQSAPRLRRAGTSPSGWSCRRRDARQWRMSAAGTSPGAQRDLLKQQPHS